MSLTYFIQKDCVQMLSDSLYNHKNNEKGKDIFNMLLKPCLYTQTNMMTFIDNQLKSREEKWSLHSTSMHWSIKWYIKKQFRKKKMVDIVSVSLYVCVCIQPKLGNINKIASLWLSWPARMHLDALDLWLLRAFGLKNSGAEQRFVSKSALRKNNGNNTVWKRWSSVCAYVCVHLSH